MYVYMFVIIKKKKRMNSPKSQFFKFFYDHQINDVDQTNLGFFIHLFLISYIDYIFIRY